MSLSCCLNLESAQVFSITPTQLTVVPKITGKPWLRALSVSCSSPIESHSPGLLPAEWLNMICPVIAHLPDGVLRKLWRLHCPQMYQMMDRVHHCSCCLWKICSHSTPYLRRTQAIYPPRPNPSLLSPVKRNSSIVCLSCCWSTCYWICQSWDRQWVQMCPSVILRL